MRGWGQLPRLVDVQTWGPSAKIISFLKLPITVNYLGERKAEVVISQV
jgi:hypothetical protein